MAPYDKKEQLEISLMDICRTYQHHQRLFTRQRLHTNTHIDNFIIHKKTLYTLDLSHIQEDYVLVDLRGVVDSCLFLDMPASRIKTIIKDYFTRHKMGGQYLFVLDTLVKISLIKEYLKIIQREKSVEISTFPHDLVLRYQAHLPQKKGSVITALKKMNGVMRSMI